MVSSGLGEVDDLISSWCWSDRSTQSFQFMFYSQSWKTIEYRYHSTPGTVQHSLTHDELYPMTGSHYFYSIIKQDPH